MTLLVYFQAPDIETFQAITAQHGFATITDGVWQPHPDVTLGQATPMDKTTGEPVPGVHFNAWVNGGLERMLTQGLPQTGANGQPLDLFERTHILALIKDLRWIASAEDPIPPGYVGKSGVRIFPPEYVSSPALVLQ